MRIGIDYEVRIPQEAELEMVRQLRHTVLDADRSEPAELKMGGTTDLDPETIHVAAFAGERIVSTVRINPTGYNGYLVRKMATDEECRGYGIGGAVLAYAETLAWFRGAKLFTLDSRERALPFYRRLGYTETGEEIMYDGSTHYRMMKRALVDDRLFTDRRLTDGR